MKTIVIERDPDPVNPREDFDNQTSLACWHRYYSLGDEEGISNLREMIEEALEGAFRNRFPAAFRDNYSIHDEEFADGRENPLFVDLGDREDFQRALQLIDDNERYVHREDRIISLPVYMYDHSGITINTTGFSCSWDSGQVGIIAVKALDAIKEFGLGDENTRLTKNVVEKIEHVLKNDVRTLDISLRGEIYGFTIYEHKPGEDPEQGEFVDSCWGFYSDKYGEDFNSNGMSDYWPDDSDDYQIIINGRVFQESSMEEESSDENKHTTSMEAS